MSEHVCRCRNCDRETFPQGAPEGPGHIAIRFHEHGSVRPTAFLRPYLDGEEQKRVDELMCGEDGWVIRFCEPVHRCQSCLEGVCAEKVCGNVWVEGELTPREHA